MNILILLVHTLYRYNMYMHDHNMIIIVRQEIMNIVSDIRKIDLEYQYEIDNMSTIDSVVSWLTRNRYNFSLINEMIKTAMVLAYDFGKCKHTFDGRGYKLN